MYLPNMKSVALPVFEIIAIEVWGGDETQSWGRGGRRGSGMVPFERGLMTSYRHSIVTFPLSLPVSEILPLLCASGPFFPTPPLVSPKFPHVPLEPGGWRLVPKERRCCANCPGSLFLTFPTYVITIHERHRQTDRQTDGRTDTMQSQYRAMHIVHRAVKSSIVLNR